MSVASIIETEPKGLPLRPGWKTTGWQGVTLQAPSEWNLVAYSGDGKTGSLRLDNGEIAAKSVLGVELRWSQPKGELTDAELEKRLDTYFASIAKDARRQKLTLDSKSKPLRDERHSERDAARSFSWRTDRRGVGRIWHCRECGRLIIAQVTGGAGGDWTHTAADVLRSLECHPTEVGWRTWSLYDLLTDLPADYALQGKPQLMNVYVQLTFALGQSLDTVTVEQWGVANVQLRGAYLNEWFRQKSAAQQPMLRYQEAEFEAHGHPALLLTGRRAGAQFWASQGLQQVTRLQKPATYFAACLWECPQTNKVYLVQSFSRRSQEDLLREIVGRTPCHS